MPQPVGARGGKGLCGLRRRGKLIVTRRLDFGKNLENWSKRGEDGLFTPAVSFLGSFLRSRNQEVSEFH